MYELLRPSFVTKNTVYFADDVKATLDRLLFPLFVSTFVI